MIDFKDLPQDKIYFQDDDVVIYCADCREILPNLPKVDLVLTDPPYGISIVKNGMVGADFGVANKGKYTDVIGDVDKDIAKLAFSYLVKVADKLIIFGGNYFLDFLPPSDGWLIWDKRGDTGIRNTFADGEMAWCSFHTPVRIYRQLWNGMIREGEHDKRLHPTQKPHGIISSILRDFSKEGDLILDPFLGSGTTAYSAKKLGRKCIGIEISEKYCEIARNRLRQSVMKL